MDLSKLSKDDLVIVSTMLMEGYKVEDIEASLVPESIRDITYNLHLFLCDKNHDEGDCDFYTDPTYAKSGKEWADMVRTIMEKYKASEDNMLAALALSFEIYDKISKRGVIGIVTRHLLHTLFEKQLSTYLPTDSDQDHSPQS